MQLLKVTNDGALHFQLNDGRIGASYSSGYVRVSTKSSNNSRMYQINKKISYVPQSNSKYTYYQRVLIPSQKDRLAHLIKFNAKNCNAKISVPKVINGADVKKEFKALFPMEVKVTQAMLDNAVPSDIYSCAGAKALNKGLGKVGRSLLVARASWGDSSGYQTLKCGETTTVIAVQKTFLNGNKEVSMMDMITPTTITLIAR
tara:strand:+ start:536 stop:1141 length:606 start_codon:yes stop_codon:yes gene_type:complete